MKKFKIDIINRMVEKAAEEKIVTLFDTAKEFGLNHIDRHDCDDIASKLQNAVPGYKVVRLCSSSRPNDSLFCTLAIVDATVSFEEADA